MSVGDQDRDASLGECVDVWGVEGHGPVGGEHEENAVLVGFLEGHVVLETVDTVLDVEVVPVEGSSILFEVVVDAAFLDENLELLVPFLIGGRIFLGLIPKMLQDPLRQESLQLVH